MIIYKWMLVDDDNERELVYKARLTFIKELDKMQILHFELRQLHRKKTEIEKKYGELIYQIVNQKSIMNEAENRYIELKNSVHLKKD